jgi:nucleoside phosphorylase
MGWICALKEEIAAAKMMMDEIHPGPQYRDPSDSNHYILGRIQKHNIVIAFLPSGIYGNIPAAIVANNMIRTFNSITTCLLVGVAGGVPSAQNTIRMGDIVVGQPNGTSPGVIQHDSGKVVGQGKFERNGQLNSLPIATLKALNLLRAKHETEKSQVSEFVRDMLEKKPSMKKSYCYQGQEKDCLYQATDRGPPQEVQRVPREDTDPRIHYGSIASGNLVIKCAPKRDELRIDLNALCCETEAAGVLHALPCLVIRGICDYCDSHKDKIWQPYAAATAAAFAKELLHQMVPGKIQEEKSITLDGR